MFHDVPTPSVSHNVKRTTCIQFDWSFQRIGGVSLCKLYEEILLPWKLNKQSSSFYVRAWRMLMKFLVVFSLFLRLSLLSPLFFALIFLQFVAVDIATPSISSLNCLLLSTPVSSHPTFSSVSTSFLRVHADSLETLYFRSAVFPTVFSRFHCRSRDFLYLGCFNVAFIWLSLAVTFLFSRFPTFRLFSSLLFIFRPFVYAYTLLFKSPR